MNSIRIAAASAALLVLGGCAASASPRWDSEFGDHARILGAQQLIEPGAPARNGQTVAKVDGRNVRDAMGQQGDSFRAPPPSTTISIGVGSSGGR